MAFPNIISGVPGFEKSVSTSKKHRLGTKMVLPDGRTFVYSKAAEAITAGKVTMQVQTATDHIMDLAVASAAASGDKTITVTNGASTAIAVDDYADGYLFVNDDAGEGQIFTIASNTAAATSASVVFTLSPNDSVRTALTTSSLVGIHKPFGASVEVFDASDVDGVLTGVPACDVASGEYFWNQTTGPAAVLTSGTVVLGKEVYTTASVDGAAGPGAADTSALSLIGGVMAAAVTTDYSLVDLKIRA